MNKKDFSFDLPTELIATYPLKKRSDSRLLHFNRQNKNYAHHQFKTLPQLLKAGDLLVLNDTKVIPARFFGQKETGGHVEVLVERQLSDTHFLAHIRASKAPKNGSFIVLEKNYQIKILEKRDDIYFCETENLPDVLDKIGHIPLPLYIDREDEELDKERYQTVYARHQGSVAAPTAGLHFDEELIADLQRQHIDLAYLTLHVGAGTFRPVRTENILEHKMHTEQFEISEEVCEKIAQTRQRNGRIIAVGTTTVRSLESAFQNGEIKCGRHETNIFIYPGYEFKVCDGIITNFHLPESTLLMLVSAFIGREQTLELYQEAIQQRYRFYSYGDASLLI